MLRSVCVFCGSNEGSRPIYAEAAREVGAELASRGLRVVYGGGRVGLMGALADAALAAGGEVFGVIPEALMAKELGHLGLTRLLVVKSMHERKARMAELADAFVALPGGYGTFEEFCEVLTWTQLGFHEKPCGLLNLDGFYAGLLQQVGHAAQEGFIRPEHSELVLVDHDIRGLLDSLSHYRHRHLNKWIRRDQT